MGEYAKRNDDGQEIKIGTCEDMYYLRYSDRSKVSRLQGNLDPNDDGILKELRWRLPFPDEDKVRPGEYKEYNRGAKLYDFFDPNTAKDPGIEQYHNKYGMLVNIACYHGEKLPEDTKELKFHWNGKSPAYELTALKFINGEVFGIYTCIECGHSWRAPLKQLIPFMGGDNAELRNRLIEWYAPDLFVKKAVI